MDESQWLRVLDVAKTKKSGKPRPRQPTAKGKRRAGQYRTTQVMVRVTADEKRMMVRAAEREGDSLSTWLRRRALQRVKQLKLTVR